MLSYVLTEICMERCVGVGSYLLTRFLLFIIPSWGFLRAKAQSIERHDWMLQFNNIRFSFAFKSFPASSRDDDRSVLFVGGTSPLPMCYLFLHCWELHLFVLITEVILSSFSRLSNVHIQRFCNLSSCIRDFWNEWCYWNILIVPILIVLKFLGYLVHDLGMYSFLGGSEACTHTVIASNYVGNLKQRKDLIVNSWTSG